MQPSPLAGPSSPRALSLASGPPPPASASPLPLPVPEPYDSSLKPYPKPTARSNAPSTYAAGGQETDGPDGDEQEGGDLGVRARSSPVRTRDKGKQRAVEPDYAHVRSASGDVVLDMRPDEDDDDVEAIEERRIQENLAKWSRADAKRRASLRRSTKLVMPALPAPPAPLSPTALVRRTSTLLRAGSRRRPGGAGTGALEVTDFELGRAGAAEAMQLEEGVAGRRARRKLSIESGEGEDAADPASGQPRRGDGGGLARVGEADEGDSDGAASSAANAPSPFDDASLATPTSTHTSNPFAPSSSASFVSLESTATDRTARTASRFIEDLPGLASPPASAATTPHASPAKLPRGGAGGSSSSDNPFLDVVVTSPTPTRPGAFHSSTQPHGAASAPVFGAPQPPRTPSPGWSSAHSDASRSTTPYSSPGLYPSGPSSASSARRRRSSARGAPEPRALMHPDAPASAERYGASRARSSGSGAAEDAGEDDDIGWLDWLLCGCFRAGGGQRDGRIEQQGRTNPME